MMKKLLLPPAAALPLFVLLASSLSCGFGAKDVYVAGTYSVRDPDYVEGVSWERDQLGGRVDVAAVWKNDAILYRLGDGKTWSRARSLCVSGKDVYSLVMEGEGATVYKNDTVLFRLGAPEYVMPCSIHVLGKDVYTFANGNVWKNSVLHTSGTLSFCVSGNDVYAAVGENAGGGKSAVTIRKNGVTEHRLPDGGYGATVASLHVSGKDVYAAGAEHTRPNGDGIATVWKNGAALRIGDGKGYSRAEAVFVADRDLYVAGHDQAKGDYDDDNGVVWKNGAVLFRFGRRGTVRSINVLGGDVYVSYIHDEYDESGMYPPGVLKNGRFIGGLLACSGKDAYLAGRDDQTNDCTIWKNGEAKHRPKEGWSEIYALFVK